MAKHQGSKVLIIVGAFLSSGLSFAQMSRPGAWVTNSADPQRTGWQKSEAAITKESVKGLKLMWKLKLDNQTRALHSLLAPLVVPAIYRNLVIVPGSSDNIYAIDADLGRIAWKRHFEYQSDTPQSSATWLCPGGITATPVAAVPGFGRGAAPPVVPGSTPARALSAPAAGGGGGGRGGRMIYAISGDGKLHQLNITTGEDLAPPVQFVPANGKPYALNLVGDFLYTATGQHCGGNPNAVYAMDLASPDKADKSFSTGGGGIWGLAGPAVGTDGTVYAETGDGPFDPARGKYSDTFLALTPKELALKDYYTPTAMPWITKRDLDLNNTPVVFSWKGRDLIAGSGKEGRIYLLDSKSLGGGDHRTPLLRTLPVSNEGASFDASGIWGNLATWEDLKGSRWIVAPIWGGLESNFRFPLRDGEAPHGSIAAFKVEEDKDGKPALTPAWASRDMIAPAPPVIANGVVFGLSSGEYTVQLGADRVANSTHATLYALDAETGKQLYSSGDTITSFTHFGGLAVADGAVFLGTYDNTVYAFGFPMEH
jgi:outer membrane protein assembly factor BamB